MATANDFLNLPDYRRHYAPGDQVFAWQGPDPVHGIITRHVSGRQYEVLTATGIERCGVAWIRPGNAQVVTAWLQMLAEQSEVVEDIVLNVTTHEQITVNAPQ